MGQQNFKIHFPRKLIIWDVTRLLRVPLSCFLKLAQKNVTTGKACKQFLGILIFLTHKTFFGQIFLVNYQYLRVSGNLIESSPVTGSSKPTRSAQTDHSFASKAFEPSYRIFNMHKLKLVCTALTMVLLTGEEGVSMDGSLSIPLTFCSLL